jgi:lipid-A-disaccharide synthase
MVIAGEASGDALAAELVRALREIAQERTSFAPRFFGAGGPKMAEAGVELELDLTQHAVVGLFEVLKHYARFRRIFHRLLRLALARKPDAILLVDFSGFNRRFAAALKSAVRSRTGVFHNWDPKIIYYVSPQVWASRPGRARQIERDVDLLLSIFPFEKEWYAARAPALRVEFVGHPIRERYAGFDSKVFQPGLKTDRPLLLLLPGSRRGEINRHLPVMLEAMRQMAGDRAVSNQADGSRKCVQVRPRLIFPDAALQAHARTVCCLDRTDVRVGGLAESLAEADLAIASTGTVTLECAYFRVPTVAIYKTSWSTYQIGKRVVQVKHLAMPNILAGKELFPELIQEAATPEAIAREALALLNDSPRRKAIQQELNHVVESLGEPGAPTRAARSILQLLGI